MAVVQRRESAYGVVKRTLDLFAAILLTLVASPLLIVLSIALSVGQRSSPFFFQERIGRNESTFRVIKFKTMNGARDMNGRLLSDAARLTQIGRFVRKTSLDELPQLFNIIRGQMSFIGPRPLLVRYLPYYKPQERIRHAVRPGITGLAQTKGRNDLGWDARLAYDISYVENFSAIQDARLLVATVVTVVTASGVKVDVLSGEMRDLDVERSS